MYCSITCQHKSNLGGKNLYKTAKNYTSFGVGFLGFGYPVGLLLHSLKNSCHI